MRPANFLAVDTEDSFISGRSIRVVYQPSSQTITLYSNHERFYQSSNETLGIRWLQRGLRVEFGEVL